MPSITTEYVVSDKQPLPDGLTKATILSSNNYMDPFLSTGNDSSIRYVSTVVVDYDDRGGYSVFTAQHRESVD